MSRTDRLRRLDRTLGRLYFRSVGLLVAAFTLGAAWMTWGAWETGALWAAVLTGTVAMGGAALTRYCFSRGRRLTELDF